MKPALFSGHTWMPEPSSCWVITGPIGSGKTALALALAKANPKTASIVTFAQQASTANTDWQGARYHSFVEYNFRTVEQALTYDVVNHINPFEERDPELEKRITFEHLREKLIPLLQLDHLLKQWTVQLSNGEQRRLLLARALLQQRPLLILDDPFAGLDTTIFQTLHTLLNTLHTEGKTLVLTIRNDDEIPSCATHLLRLTKEHRFTQKVLDAECAVRGAQPKRPPAITPYTLRTTHPQSNSSLLTPHSRSEVLRFENVTYAPGGRLLFRHFSWSVHQGERWLIQGPNGSGKSTLLSLITGDNPMAYAFRILRFGESLGRGKPLWQMRCKIASVTPEQQSCLPPTITLLDMVLTGHFDAEGRPCPPDDQDLAMAETLLSEFGLTPYTKATIAELSAGHCRLALVARALMAHPQLLLLDELCMNLEVNERDTVLTLLTDFLDKHPELTAIFVAHRADHVPAHIDAVLSLPTDTLL